MGLGCIAQTQRLGRERMGFGSGGTLSLSDSVGNQTGLVASPKKYEADTKRRCGWLEVICMEPDACADIGD